MRISFNPASRAKVPTRQASKQYFPRLHNPSRLLESRHVVPSRVEAFHQRRYQHLSMSMSAVCPGTHSVWPWCPPQIQAQPLGMHSIGIPVFQGAKAEVDQSRVTRPVGRPNGVDQTTERLLWGKRGGENDGFPAWINCGLGIRRTALQGSKVPYITNGAWVRIRMVGYPWASAAASQFLMHQVRNLVAPPLIMGVSSMTEIWSSSKS